MTREDIRRAMLACPADARRETIDGMNAEVERLHSRHESIRRMKPYDAFAVRAAWQAYANALQLAVHARQFVKDYAHGAYDAWVCEGARVWVTSDHAPDGRSFDCEPFEVWLCHVENCEDRIRFAFNTDRAYVATHCAGGTFSLMKDGSQPRFRSVRPVGWTLADVDC